MFFKKIKREHELVKAFHKLFLTSNEKLKPEAEIVIEFLRDEAGARGELGTGGVPYFYDAQNRFDPNAAAFLLGKRRMFDLLVKYCSRFHGILLINVESLSESAIINISNYNIKICVFCMV